MRSFDSFELVYTEIFETRSQSLKREYQLKQLTRKEKDQLLLQQSHHKPQDK